MEKERTLDKKNQKEIKELERQKNKAKEKGDLLEAAKISNCIGEILSENGFFKDAIKEHKEEIYYSEASRDTIGVAVGYRKVGECYCEMGRFEEAIEHQQKHLKIAKSESNNLEQQRALATIGRTYFVQAERLSGDEDASKDNLLKSQEAYLRSLDICRKLGDDVSEKEKLEMKARLYLNLGLIYENKLNYNEAMKFVSKALLISKEQGLQDNVFRCHLTLFGLYLNNNNLENALQSSRAALMIAQKGNNKANEMESLSQMGLAFLRLGDFVAALNTLKRVYKFTNQTSGVDPIVAANLKLAMTFIKCSTNYEKCDDKKELLSICDKLGDLYSELGAPKKALKYYLQQLNLAGAINLDGKSFASIYVSIAVTYSECKQYEKALEYHQKELNVKHGDLAEKSSTYCAIATCLENLGLPFQEIKDCYMKAIEYAQGSGDHVVEMRAYRDWLETLRSYGYMEEYENVSSKMKHIQQEYDITESESEDQESCDSPMFSDGELVMLGSEDEDVEEAEVACNSNRKTTCQMKKINKVNERGETPLHCAAINGNFDKVKTLLLQGATVKCRDYCGWTPLHEACNHGHIEIVDILIKYQADVNDPGGQHCRKITPLHDASQNGHIEIVKLLVANGASLTVKNVDGQTPLEFVKASIKADEEEFYNNSKQSTITHKRKEVERFLLTSQKQLNYKQIPEISRNRNDKLFGDPFVDLSCSDEGEIEELPSKKKKRNHNRWEDMNDNINAIIPGKINEPSLIDNENVDFTSDSQSFQDSESEEDLRNMCSTRGLLVERQIQNKTSNKKSSIHLPTQDNHTDIHFRKSPVCTSLINETNIPLQDFIIDDMATKRKRQSKIKYSKEVENSGAVGIGNSSGVHSVGINKVKNKKKASNTFKQKRIERYTEIDITDDDSNQSNPSDFPINQDISLSTKNSNQQIIINQSNLFRIKIRVNQQLFLIPILNRNENTIEWLLNEAKERYQNLSGISTKLLLKTRDGALLNPSDIIRDILMNDEELVAEVIGLDFPPLIERYRTACKAINVKPVSRIEEQIMSSQNFSEFQIRDLFVRLPSLEAIFSSMSCSMGLTNLDVSRTFIGDINFSTIVNVLRTLPSITTLKFSCIGITTKSLQDLAHLLSDGIKEEFKIIMKDLPLHHLSVLHVDNNDFDNQGQFMIYMGKILSHCKFITDLNLESCKLGSIIFDSQSTFRSSLKVSRVSTLNLCNNPMGSNDFISNIFSSINLECLKSLNLSRTSVNKQEFVVKKICKKLEDLSNGLQELKLDSLPVCFSMHHTRNISLERLSLRYQVSDLDRLGSLYKCCMQITNLAHLDLSFSENINNDFLEFVLQDLKTNTSMKNLVLNCCAINSPLSENIFCRLSEVNKCGLSSIDLSYNEIESQDKCNLFDAWYIVHRNDAMQELNQFKCLLFIR